MKAVLVTNIVTPYRIPVWNSLSKHVNEFHVLVCARLEKNRIWCIDKDEEQLFNLQYLRGISFYIRKRYWGIHLNYNIWIKLNKILPSVIIVSGYDAPSYLIALLYAKLHKIPLVMWWGSHGFSIRAKRGFIGYLRKYITKCVDSFITYGSMATAYLRSLEVPTEKIITGVNTVDVIKYSILSNKFRNTENSNTGITRYLYVGQFLERKGVFFLLKAFKALSEEKVSLTFVGYGPAESQMKDYIFSNALRNVKIVGPTKTIEETAVYYANSDILAVPTLQEVWGLVINEALASGLFVVASNTAGASVDLIARAPLKCGILFAHNDILSLQTALRQALIEIKSCTRKKIQEWGCIHTPERYAKSIYQAVKLAIDSKNNNSKQQ